MRKIPIVYKISKIFDQPVCHFKNRLCFFRTVLDIQKN